MTSRKGGGKSGWLTRSNTARMFTIVGHVQAVAEEECACNECGLLSTGGMAAIHATELRGVSAPTIEGLSNQEAAKGQKPRPVDDIMKVMGTRRTCSRADLHAAGVVAMGISLPSNDNALPPRPDVSFADISSKS